MITAFIELLAGGLFLWLAGEAVVRGAASLALRRGVSHLVVGLTIVAFGTSAPELFVSGLAAWQGNPDIALGNVIGSNIANLGLVLGLTALLKPLMIKRSLIKKEIPFMIIVTIAVYLMALNKVLGLIEGAALLFGLLVFILYSLKTGKPEDSQDDTGLLDATWKEWVYLLLGFAGLLIGSKLFINGAVSTARYFGVSEFFIGLSVVAIGTSLPELAASLIAVIRKQSDIAIGNLVGSNIFNLLLILGSASIIRPITVSTYALLFDFLIMIGLTVILFPIAKTQQRISRFEGALLLGIYIYYITKIAMRG